MKSSVEIGRRHLSPRTASLALSTVEQLTGLELTGTRRAQLLSHIERRSGAQGITADDFIEALSDYRGSAELRQVVALITNQETSFCRGPHQLEVFETGTLGPLLEGDPSGTVRLWSAACSTGEEAITLGMMVKDITGSAALPGVHYPTVEIVASDVCVRTVEAARSGRYSAMVESRIGPVRVDRYFLSQGNALVVNRQALPPIEYHVHNLVSAPRFGRFDVVFVRNVMFYLSEAAKRRVIRNVEQSLVVEGTSVFGANDGVQLPDSFTSVGAHCYRLDGRRS